MSLGAVGDVISRLLQDVSHEDEEVQHGDYDLGMKVTPGPYLSDSDLSVTSIELSPAQVSERRLWRQVFRPVFYICLYPK